MSFEQFRIEWASADMESVLESLRDEATGLWDVPGDISERACSRVRARIPWDGDRPELSRARVEAYYWAVVRGIALRSRGKEVVPLKSRFALAAIVEDMRSRGMSPRAVRDAVLDAHADLLRSAGINETQLDMAG